MWLEAHADHSFAFHKTSCQTWGLFEPSRCHVNKARVYTRPRLLSHKDVHPCYRLYYELCKTAGQALGVRSKLDACTRERMPPQAPEPAPCCSRLRLTKTERLSCYYAFTGKRTHTDIGDRQTHTPARRGPSLHFLNTVQLSLPLWQRRIAAGGRIVSQRARAAPAAAHLAGAAAHAARRLPRENSFIIIVLSWRCPRKPAAAGCRALGFALAFPEARRSGWVRQHPGGPPPSSAAGRCRMAGAVPPPAPAPPQRCLCAPRPVRSRPLPVPLRAFLGLKQAVPRGSDARFRGVADTRHCAHGIDKARLRRARPALRGRGA